MLQRDPTAAKTIEKGRQAPAPPSTPTVVPPLSPKEREELERFTGNRIDRAFVAFVSACKDNREAVKAAAKADAENAALFIDIAPASSSRA
jgi:pyruvate kinase